MNLRSTSLARQVQVWGFAAAAALLFYLFLVFAFDDGTAWWAIWRATRMRYFLPIAVLYGFVAYETRVDWDKAGECPKNDDIAPLSGEPVVRERIVQQGEVRLDDKFFARLKQFVDDRIAAREAVEGGARIRTFRPQIRDEDVEALSAEELWNRAESLRHGFVPDPDIDGEHLSLVYAAAYAGHVQALVRLGEYAFRRETYVEAYFWTKSAQCRVFLSGNDPDAAKVIGDFLREIRKAWAMEEGPDEAENVYSEFSSLRGSLARAMLSYDSGMDRAGADAFVRRMAQNGSADAALFAHGLDATRYRRTAGG